LPRSVRDLFDIYGTRVLTATINGHAVVINDDMPAALVSEVDPDKCLVTNKLFEDKRTPLFFEWHEVTANADRLKGRRQLLRNGQAYDSNGHSGFLYMQGELCSEFATANAPLARKVGDRCGSRMVGNQRVPNDANCYCFALSRDDKLPLHTFSMDVMPGIGRMLRSDGVLRRVEVMRVLLPPGVQTTEFLRATRDAVRPPAHFHESARKWLMANERRLMMASARAGQVATPLQRPDGGPIDAGAWPGFEAAFRPPQPPPAGAAQPPWIPGCPIDLARFNALVAAADASPQTIPTVMLSGHQDVIALTDFVAGERAVELVGHHRVPHYYHVESLRGWIRLSTAINPPLNPLSRERIMRDDVRLVRFVAG